MGALGHRFGDKYDAATDRLIIDAIEAGIKTYAQIADEIGVSRNAINTRIRKLKAAGRIRHVVRTAPDAWSEEDIERLKQLKGRGVPVATIARMLGRTEVAIMRKFAKLNGGSQHETAARQRENVAWEMHRQGCSNAEIAERLGCTRNGASGLLFRYRGRHGIVSEKSNKNRQSTSADVFRQKQLDFEPGSRQAIAVGLRCDGLSFGQSAQRMGVTRSAVSGILDRGAHGATPRQRSTPVRPADAPDVALDGDGGRFTMLTIGPRQCRWPHGDPLAEDFHLCGQPAEKNGADGVKPYCPYHCGRAAAKKPVGDEDVGS